MSGPAAIAFDDVWFSYNRVHTLEHVSFEVAPGRFAALIGPNGAGKTTALHLLLGLLRPTRGRVLIFGQVPGRQREPVGYIPQHVAVPRGFPLTVLEMVVMGRYGRLGVWRRAGPADRDAAVRALDRVGLAHLAGRYFETLSGGQQQRALIARALAGDPQLLLLDEPTAGLDPAARADFYNLCCRLQHDDGLTLLAASHDIDAVAHHADRVILLNRTVLAAGSPHDVLHAPVLQEAYRFPAPHHDREHGHDFRDAAPS